MKLFNRSRRAVRYFRKKVRNLRNASTEELLDFGGRAKSRYDRGVAWFSWAKDIALLIVFITSIEPKLIAHGFGYIVPWLYPLLPTMYCVGAYVVGHIDEMKGIWKRQTAYLSRQVNPVMANIENIVIEIKEHVEQLAQKQEDQSKQIDDLGRAIHGVYWDGKD